MSLPLPALAAEPGFHLGDIYVVGLFAGGLALLLAVVALSRESDRAFSSAIVYLLMGVILSVGLQARGIDLLDPLTDAGLIERASEIAVVVALFSVGIRLDRRFSLRGWSSTARLIGLAMPLTIVAVAAFGHLLMGLSLGAAIVLGAALAPTDPVLAGEVQVGAPGEGGEEEPRFALTSEAGLNDGLAFPFVFLGLLVAGPETGWGLEWAFAGGLAFRRREREHEYHGPVHEGASVVEKVSELALILLLGSTVTLAGLAEAGVAGWILAAALLLAIRPISVLFSFAGSRLHRREKLFIGWFGVRGIGSFYYVAVAIGAGVLRPDEALTIYWTVVVCVGVSIIVHGLSGAPATRRMGLDPP